MTGLVIGVLVFNAWLFVRAKLNKESLVQALQKIIPNEFDIEGISISANGTVRLRNLVVYAQKRTTASENNTYEKRSTAGPKAANIENRMNNTGDSTGDVREARVAHVAAREIVLNAPLVTVKVDMLSMLGGKTIVESIELRDPVVGFKQLPDGSWLAGGFFHKLARADGAEAPPLVLVQNGALLVETADFFKEGHTHRFERCDVSLRPFGPSSLVVEGKCSAGELGQWTIGGELDAANKVFNLSLKAERLEMSDRIGALLSPTFAEAWDNYHPCGLAEMTVKLKRPPGGDARMFYAVDLALNGVSVTWKGFPYEIADVRGTIRFLKEGAEIYGLKGRSGATSIGLSGHTNGYDTDAGFELEISLRNLSLDRKLYNALDKKSREVWDMFAPAGKINAFCEVTREFGNDKPVINNMEVSCLNVSANVRDFPYEVTGIEGKLRFGPGTIKIHKLHSREGDRVIDVEGMIESLDKEPAFDILVTAENLPLDDRLREACNTDTLRVWDTFSLGGKIDLSWNARKGAAPGSAAQHNVKVKCRSVRACHKDFAFPLDRLEGEVVFDGERANLDRLKGKNGDSSVEISGHISLKDEDKPLVLEIKGKDLPLAEQTVRAFPPQIRGVVQDAKVAGKFDFTARVEQRKTKDAQQPGMVTSYIAELILIDCSMDVGMAFSEISGRATIRGAQGLPPESTLGSIQLGSLAVQDRRFNDVTGQFLFSNDVLIFNDVRAGAYGGLLTGFFRVDTKTKEFDSTGSLCGLDMKEYVRDRRIQGKQMSGKMDGNFTVKGKGTDITQLWGEGRLNFKNGYLWDVPLFLEMVNLFSLKKRQPFTEGSARLKIRGRTVVVREARFSNEDITMVGTGHIDFDGNQLLRFKTRFSTSMLPSIDLLTKAWELIRDNIAMVEATGTFNEPKLTIKPLPAVFSPMDDTPD
jgi:hypothetical protein